MANSDHPKRIEPPSGNHQGVEETGPRSSGFEPESPDQASAKKPALDPVPLNLMEQIVTRPTWKRPGRKSDPTAGPPVPTGSPRPRKLPRVSLARWNAT